MVRFLGTQTLSIGRLNTIMAFEYQSNSVLRAMTPSWCLLVEKVALGMRLVCNVIM